MIYPVYDKTGKISAYICEKEDDLVVNKPHWNFDEYGWACSECDWPIPRSGGKLDKCPHCGTDMSVGR